MNPHRYMWHWTNGVVMPTTWELISDGSPPEWWLTKLEDDGWAPVVSGWIKDTEWTPVITV